MSKTCLMHAFGNEARFFTPLAVANERSPVELMAYRFLLLGQLNLVRVHSKISRRVPLALRRASCKQEMLAG